MILFLVQKYDQTIHENLFEQTNENCTISHIWENSKAFNITILHGPRYAKVALKDHQLLVNLKSISFQSKKGKVNAWYKLTRNYFENQNFTLFEEKIVKKDFCSQFRVKQDVSSEYYVINFYTSGTTLSALKIIAHSYQKKEFRS